MLNDSVSFSTYIVLLYLGFPSLFQQKMVPAIGLSCSNMIKKLKAAMVSEGGSSCEIDIWPCLEDLTGHMISRTAFGSSHEEGTRIFQLQTERTKLNVQQIQFLFIPGWR